MTAQELNRMIENDNAAVYFPLTQKAEQRMLRVTWAQNKQGKVQVFCGEVRGWLDAQFVHVNGMRVELTAKTERKAVA